MAYAQIHHKKKFDKVLMKVKEWSEKEINDYFSDKTISLNSKSPSKITRKNRKFKNHLISAIIVNNNSPDITRVKGEEIKGIDLITYSFPCQGLSIANMGRDEGIKKDSKSTSNLIWQIRRILLEANQNKQELPKYLLMENVKNLIGKKHKKDYLKWKEFLSELGYTTKTIVLNGLNHNSLQKRERVFGISILNNKNEVSDEEFKIFFVEKYGKKLSIKKRKEKYEKILNSSNTFMDEIKSAIPNKTPSRIKMGNENRDLENVNWKNGFEFTFNTLTTKQDRHPNIGMVKLKNEQMKKGKLKKRFITPREGYMIMGFESEDFNKVKPLYLNEILTKESLYRQSGNSIVVQMLEAIFNYIKDYKGRKNE